MTSIEAVKQRMAQLRAQIDLTSRSDTQRMNRLISEYKQAKTEVDKFNQSLNAGAKQNASAINGVANGFMNMYQAIKLVIGAQIVRELVSTTLEMAKLQGQTEAVERAFRRQVVNSEGLLHRLRKATQGTVGDVELMQRALKFQNFGADVQQLPVLLEFAAVRAQQTGDSVDYLVNSIVNGIGRKSILVLDNLGISATRLKEELGGVSTQAASVADVTAAVGRVAQEELEKMGGFAVNAATGVDRLAVAWQELRIEVSKKLESGGLIDFFQDVVEGGKTTIRNFTLDILGFFGAVKREGIQVEALKQALEDVDRIRKSNNGTLQQQFDLIQQEINSRVQVIGQYNDTVEALKAENEELKKTEPYGKRREQVRQQITAYYANKIVIEETIKALIGYRQEIENLMRPEAAQIVTIKTLRDQLEALQKQREEATSIGDTGELDRLQREINLLEDRILKISDNIEWEKKWRGKQVESLEDMWRYTDAIEAQKDALEELADQYKVVSGGVPEFDPDAIENPAEIATGGWEGGNEKRARFRLAMRKWFKENADELKTESIDFGADLLNTALDIEANSYRIRLDNLQNFYDRQNLLAGDNERYKKELAIRQHRDTLRLEREQAQAQKRARKFSIAIDTAASIAKAWVNPGYPGAIPLTIFLAAQGLAQAAIVDKAQPGFKDGVIDLKGPGTTKSDSISARLSKGESVMTAEETQSSMKTLKAIRAKKLDDKKLDRIIKTGAITMGKDWDDSRINEHLQRIERAIGNNDYMDQGVLLMKVSKSRDGLTKIIRSKSING